MHVLILSEEEDFHSRIVAQRLSERGARATVWNTGWFPSRDQMAWSIDRGGTIWIDGHSFDLLDFKSIWWRRFKAPVPHPEVSDNAASRFVRSESTFALKGMLQSHPRIHNGIWQESRAANKLYQLREATAVGLTIPKTVISNRPPEVRVFCEDYPNAIIKPIYGNYPHGLATRRMGASDLADDEALATSPSIIQEEVECVVDIRATIVDGRMFCAELERENADVEVDWRKTPHGWRPHELPDAVSSKLLQMMGALNLDMASFDLRLRPDGVYVFFEVNPSGQFMFLEIDAGLPVSDAVAAFLLEDR